MTTRQCDADGVWSMLDLTTCTLSEKNLTFILAWFVLEEEGGLPTERVNSTELEREVHYCYRCRSTVGIVIIHS